MLQYMGSPHILHMIADAHLRNTNGSLNKQALAFFTSHLAQHDPLRDVISNGYGLYTRMYEEFDRRILVSTKFHYFKIIPPASPYIIIPPGGIIIYELAGGNILKKRNVVDPTYMQCDGSPSPRCAA
jgi:hypothetical protein